MHSFLPGHALHFIQVRRVALSPWGWRPGTVSRIDGRAFTVHYLNDSPIQLWHAEPLEELEEGLPVRVHEQYRALEIGRTWFHVRIDGGGLGAVPEPEDLDVWNDESAERVVVEIATGRAMRVGEPPW